MYENNKSGVRGVYFSNTYKNYWANIVFQGKRYNLGRYKTIEEAKRAREKAEDILYAGFMEHYEEDLKPQIAAENERANIEGFDSFWKIWSRMKSGHHSSHRGNSGRVSARSAARLLGLDIAASCERCGRPYIVKGAVQKYCENCAGIMLQEKARKRYVPKEAVILICQICGKEL